MAERDLVSLSKFAELSEQSRQYISNLCTPAKIIVRIIGEKKFIDTSVYNPEDFKPKPKKEKS